MAEKAGEKRPPPGGHSSICFSDSPAPQGSSASVSANKFARGCDQNNGNVMTGHPTTKVVAPPGGTTSIVFDDGNEPTPPARTAKRFKGSGCPLPPPKPGEPTVRGQVPAGGKQTYKFGTPSPMPHDVRDQPTFEQSYRFGESATPVPADLDAPPVGGKAEICLGTAKPSPGTWQKNSNATAWPLGKSPAAAGKQVHTRSKPGETTMTLSATPQKSNDRLPPGGKMHNIFDRKSFANNPRFVPTDENDAPLPSGRRPPGGQSNVVFGTEKDSIPAVTKDTGSSDPPRVLEEKIERMQQRRPPGGVSTISLG